MSFSILKFNAQSQFETYSAFYIESETALQGL